MFDQECVIICLEIEGVPKALKRHRGSGLNSYDPSYNDKITFAWQVKMALESFKMPLESIVLSLEYHMPIPKSYSKKKALQCEFMPHTKTPDISNLIKFTEDALEGILWDNDKTIHQISAKKIYSKTPKTVINILDDKRIKK